MHVNFWLHEEPLYLYLYIYNECIYINIFLLIVDFNIWDHITSKLACYSDLDDNFTLNYSATALDCHVLGIEYDNLYKHSAEM